MFPRFIDSTVQNSGQRLGNIIQTHLVLASGKLVLQNNKNYKNYQECPMQQDSFNEAGY